jgi:hypothetical protein
MLHRVLPYKHAISEILRNSPEVLPLLCSMEEWDQLEQLHTFLEVFLQRNRPTIMLVHTIRASIASTSLFDIQGLFFSSCTFFIINFKLFHY